MTHFPLIFVFNVIVNSYIFFTTFNNPSLFPVIHISCHNSCQIKSLTRNTVLIELIIITGQSNVHFSDPTNYLFRLLKGIRLTYR
ncbi:hypothetical protein C0J52_11567 [Blattella germanica]|nr:hypothetical protein C0J52_11567 [Blattella germanica]